MELGGGGPVTQMEFNMLLGQAFPYMPTLAKLERYDRVRHNGRKCSVTLYPIVGPRFHCHAGNFSLSASSYALQMVNLSPSPPQSPQKTIRCTRSLLLGILGVCNVGKTAFWTRVPLMYCTTHLEDASGILHFKSGSAAHGRLHLTDTSPKYPLCGPR
eukprot:4391369-Pyramimonas_sp.AAC.1